MTYTQLQLKDGGDEKKRSQLRELRINSPRRHMSYASHLREEKQTIMQLQYHLYFKQNGEASS